MVQLPHHLQVCLRCLTFCPFCIDSVLCIGIVVIMTYNFCDFLYFGDIFVNFIVRIVIVLYYPMSCYFSSSSCST